MAQKVTREIIEELDILVSKLMTEDTEEREKILSKLNRYERSGILPLKVMLELANEESPSISMFAISALGREGSNQSVAKLVELLDKNREENPLFVDTLIDALGDSKNQKAAAPLLSILGIRKSLISKLLKKTGKKQAENNGKAELKQFYVLPVIRALEKIEDPAAAELLVPFLDHEDALVRWHTIQNIAKCGLKGQIQKLEEIRAKDDNEVVREIADIALEKLNPTTTDVVN